MSFPFNVRVYGAMLCKGHLLLSSEHYAGRDFTKLPGGGLQFGEGLREALAREFMEETGLEVEVKRHLYTTDFFVASAFDASHQVISVYYQVECLHWPEALQKRMELDTPLATLISREGKHEFTWQPLHSLTEAHFTFPIDKHIVPMLKALGSGAE